MEPSECLSSNSINIISDNQKLDLNNVFDRSPNLNKQTGYDTIFNSLPGICFQAQYLDSTLIIYINQKIQDYFGYDPDSFTRDQIQFDSLIHRSDINRRKKNIETALSDLQIYTVDYRLRDAHGRFLWVNELGQVSKNSSGIIEIFGFIRIIDVLDKPIESCIYQVDLYRTIIDSVPEFIIVVDSKNNIIDINKTVKKKFSMALRRFKWVSQVSIVPVEDRS